MSAEIPNVGTFLASATRTATTTSSAVNVDPGRTLTVFLLPTAASGTGGLTLSIEMQDPTSSTYVAIGQDMTARTGTSNLGFQVGPGSSGSGTLASSSYVMKQITVSGNVRIKVTHGDASNYTYSVTYTIA